MSEMLPPLIGAGPGDSLEAQIRSLAQSVDEFTATRKAAEEECSAATARLERLREVVAERETQVARIAEGQVEVEKLARERDRLVQEIQKPPQRQPWH